MDGDLGRPGRAGGWVVLALCALGGCNTGPTNPTVTTTAGLGDVGSVVEEVRRATDRSGAQSGVITLPGGERMRRVGLGSSFSHVLVAKPGSDGKPSVRCVESAPEAEAFLTGTRQGAGQ
jgi:hypothetical protein